MKLQAPNAVCRTPLAVSPAGAACIALSLLGCLAIYNATGSFSPRYWFAGRQLVWLLAGSVGLVAASRLPPPFYRTVTPALAALAWGALWLVLACGLRINGMRGWFAAGTVFLQPSELAKPVFVLALAGLLEHTNDRRHEWWRGFMPALALGCAWALPIALEPDFGAVLVYGLTFVVLYWSMGGRGMHLALAGVGGIPVVLFLLRDYPYAAERVAAFVNPAAHAQGAGAHILQFRQALAAGGLFGESPDVAAAGLPLAYSDSIFASTAQSVGFLGVLPLVLVIPGWILYAQWRMSHCEDAFSAAAVLGLAVMLAGQAYLHLSVNLGLVPPTGITLPLVSYGGSSLVATLVSVGIVEGLSHPDRGRVRLLDTCGLALRPAR